MGVTIFSFFLAVMWSSIIVVIQYKLIKKHEFIMMFGISSIIMLYAFSIIRMLIPLEFPFTKVINDTHFWNWLYDYLCLDTISIVGQNLTRANFLICVWVAGTLLLSINFIVRYVRSISRIINMQTESYIKADEVLEIIRKKTGKQVKINVAIVSTVQCPVGVGVIKKMVLLPDKYYSDNELLMILLHETTHFLNKDLLLKILIQFYCYIFWWNPIVYLLRKDLEQILEIKCDMTVVEKMSKGEKIEYLTTIVNVLKGQDKCLKKDVIKSVSIVGDSPQDHLVERFQIISDDNKRNSSWYPKYVWCLMLIFIIVISYSFVLQPEYNPPKKDVITESGTIDISPENYYITEQEDGNYILHNDTGYKRVISKNLAGEMKEQGFEIRKEN